MQEIMRTNDVVLISYASSLLQGEGIGAFVFDENASILGGSIGALPRRLMVADDDVDVARQTLTDAGLNLQLKTEKDTTDFCRIAGATL